MDVNDLLDGNKYGNYKLSATFIKKFQDSLNRHLENGIQSRETANSDGEYWMDTCLDDLPDEIWKDVMYFDDIITHRISNYGRLKSLVRHGNRIEKIMKPNKIRSSNDDPANYYLLFHLVYKTEAFYKLGHVLVAEHYIPNPENKPQVNHKNGIKRRNHVDNLEWNTQTENMLHAYKELDRKPVIGINHGLSKLNDSKVREIRKLYATEHLTHKALSKMYGVAPNTIMSVINNETWRHVI